MSEKLLQVVHPDSRFKKEAVILNVNGQDEKCVLVWKLIDVYPDRRKGGEREI